MVKISKAKLVLIEVKEEMELVVGLRIELEAEVVGVEVGAEVEGEVSF